MIGSVLETPGNAAVVGPVDPGLISRTGAHEIGGLGVERGHVPELQPLSTGDDGHSPSPAAIERPHVGGLMAAYPYHIVGDRTDRLKEGVGSRGLGHGNESLLPNGLLGTPDRTSGEGHDRQREAPTPVHGRSPGVSGLTQAIEGGGPLAIPRLRCRRRRSSL